MTDKPAKPASKPYRQETEFKTDKASRYLQQLMKHFAHKVEVDHTPTEGRANFPFGAAQMRADDKALSLVVEGPTARDMVQSRYVVEEHLLRFAFREAPAPLDWRPVAISADAAS